MQRALYFAIPAGFNRFTKKADGLAPVLHRKCVETSVSQRLGLIEDRILRLEPVELGPQPLRLLGIRGPESQRKLIDGLR